MHFSVDLVGRRTRRLEASCGVGHWRAGPKTARQAALAQGGGHTAPKASYSPLERKRARAAQAGAKMLLGGRESGSVEVWGAEAGDGRIEVSRPHDSLSPGASPWCGPSGSRRLELAARAKSGRGRAGWIIGDERRLLKEKALRRCHTNAGIVSGGRQHKQVDANLGLELRFFSLPGQQSERPLPLSFFALLQAHGSLVAWLIAPTPCSLSSPIERAAALSQQPAHPPPRLRNPRPAAVPAADSTPRGRQHARRATLQAAAVTTAQAAEETRHHRVSSMP